MSQLSSAEQRASYISQAQQLLAKPDFSKEDRSKFDALMAMADAHNPEADGYRIHRLNAVLAEEGIARSLNNAPRSEVSKEIRRVLKGEVRVAMNVGTGSQGAYFVPSQFEKELVLMQKAAGPLYADSELLTNIPTETGGPRVMPTSDDLANEGFVQTENAVVTEEDPTLSQVSMHAPIFSSGTVLLSNELMQDMESFGPAEKVLQKSLAARLSRIQNRTFLASLLTALAANSSAAVAAAGSAPIYSDITKLVAQVNGQYRASEKSAFIFNSATAGVLAGLLGTDGLPIFKHVLAPKPTLLDYPVYISDYADNIASGKNPILFGDFSYVTLRHVPGITLQVLRERYAEQGSTGIIARKRADLQYAVPSTSDSAIKMLHFA